MAEPKAPPAPKTKAAALAILEQQRQDITRQLEEGRAEALAEIVSNAKELAKQIGATVDDLIQALGKRTVKGNPADRKPATAKYCNPKNPTETWAGRGRKPLWVSEALKAGASLESFAIQKSLL